MAKLLNFWTTYWFPKSSVRYLAVFRIAAVGIQLFVLFYNHAFYSTTIRRLTSVPDAEYDPIVVIRLLHFPLGADFRPSAEVLMAVYALTWVAGLLGLVGLRTNLSLFVFALGNLYMTAYWYSLLPIHHPEALMTIALFTLAFSPCGKVLSLDALWRRHQLNSRGVRVEHSNAMNETSSFARWPLLLTAWLLSVMYLDAALSKLGRGGLDWLNGYTLQYVLLEDGLAKNSELGIWLGQQHMLVLWLSWITMLFEGTFFMVLVFPALALIYVPLGIALHAGMCATKIACFWQYLALYLAFIPVFAIWLPKLRSLFQRRRVTNKRSKDERQIKDRSTAAPPVGDAVSD
jgi:hypothetical protein